MPVLILLPGPPPAPEFSLTSFYDLGGPGNGLQESVYDLISPPLTAYLISTYNLIGALFSTYEGVYDLGTGGQAWFQTSVYDLLQIAQPLLIGVTPPVTTAPTRPTSTPGTSPLFVPGLSVYGKDGNYLGQITTFTLEDHPSNALNQAGTLRFTVPVTNDAIGTPNPDVDLLIEDRIVVIGDNVGGPTFGFPIDTLLSQGSMIEATCSDMVTSYIQGVEVGDAQASIDPTAVNTALDLSLTGQIIARSGETTVGVVTQIMGQVNQMRARDGELVWDVDAEAGGIFFGDENIAGDGLSALNQVADRGFGEYWSTVHGGSGRLRPVLHWRDRGFNVGTGPALSDGPGGSISVGSNYTATSQPIINAVRVTGSVTAIASQIPAGATALPIQELIPVAEVWADASVYRRRVNLGLAAGYLTNVTVPFTIPTDTTAALALAQQALMLALYKTFLAAVHDSLGRPWHNGWAWQGQSDAQLTESNGKIVNLDAELAADRYIHRRFISSASGATAPNGAIPTTGGPASVVMVAKDGSASFLRVTYDRIQGAQTVAFFSQPKQIDPETIFDFELDRFSDWDPRRDGVGKKVTVTVVQGNAITTTTQWRVVPYGDRTTDASASLTLGVSAIDTNIPLDNVLAFPDPGTKPFVATMDAESVLVTGFFGSTALVQRGYAGTTKAIHEASTTFQYTAPTQTLTDGQGAGQTTPVTPPPLAIPWPQGEAYATKFLSFVSKPKRLYDLQINNQNGDWANIHLGSIHTVNLTSEGKPPDGLTDTGRVIAMAPNGETGLMEVIVEITS